uniref:Uncharacterized protein n=1 Tax=Glossina pallidipes TaxID=7398 RepID=A0A1A9ZBY4_GLOPL
MKNEHRQKPFVQGCCTKSRQKPRLSMSVGASIPSNLLCTVFCTMPTSALNIPPHTRSSQALIGGMRSAERMQPTNSQSCMHASSIICVPPPTIVPTSSFELPDILATGNCVKIETFYTTTYIGVVLQATLIGPVNAAAMNLSDTYAPYARKSTAGYYRNNYRIALSQTSVDVH